MKRAIPLLIILSLGSSAICHAGGLEALVDVGKAQADMQRIYAEETKNYAAVKKAIEDGAIKAGQTKSEISKRYGRGVVEITDVDPSLIRWIYKSAKSSYFSGPKIYLYFDNNDKLLNVKTVGK